jgi:hypothetical protein
LLNSLIGLASAEKPKTDWRINMREIVFRDSALFDFSGGRHLITYAEEGFAPLSIYLKKLGYEKLEIQRIADECNDEDSPKCLLPEFPITVIQRRFIRDPHNAFQFNQMLTKVLEKIDARSIEDTVIFDLRTNRTSSNIKRVIDRIAKENGSRFKNLKAYGIVGWEEN